jgi:hypothetical protein
LKNFNLILLAIISLILLVSITSAQVSHPASEITAGTFGAGDYTITNTGEVFLSISNTEAEGHDYRLVSGGFGTGVGLGKFSIYDSTEDSSRLTIDSSGNVGIGTTSPNAKLDVDGGVKVKSYTTKPSCNSNTKGMFVFDENTGVDKPYVCTAADGNL